MSSLQEIRQLESDLAIAKGRLENSSDNEYFFFSPTFYFFIFLNLNLFFFFFFANSEIVTLKSQVEADKEIRTMLEKTNQEINTEVSKLKKRLEEMVQQKEQLQKEKNGFFSFLFFSFLFFSSFFFLFFLWNLIFIYFSNQIELLSDVEPSKMELERERKLRKELDVVISKQVAEINSLTEELSQADESFDEAIAKLKDRLIF